MALVRWNPFSEIDALQREMNRLFDDFYGDRPTRTNGGAIALAPAAEMEETNNTVFLRLEVPGMDANDLDIQATAEAVTIGGERKTEVKEGTRSEFRYGKFRRTIPMPARIDNRNVTANYQDGILTLTLPKAEDEKAAVVKVNLN